MKNLVYFLFIIGTLASCSDNCVTCSYPNIDPSDFQYCDDGELSFTNQNGELITFDEFIEIEESKGANCK